MKLKIENYAKALDGGVGQRRYAWRVFINEPPHVLDAIESIIYTLPPTFSRPSRVAGNANDGFVLEGYGVEEFNILATVLYKNRTEETQQYHLDFSKPWPARAVSA
ncbi:MAG: hypothetical protein OXL97_15580 [Chloroflexota bacterium]|nr:hypothetical protein [Chloroflexota bacterium]MDE2883543.1 hypothetical protein [Chloroflexota bacterium]